MTELANQNDVTQRYIARIIKLAFLAPDILQAALRGQLPSDLSLERLNAGFPLDWDEQRRVLGFSRRAERARASGAPGPANPNPLIRP